MFNLPDLTYEDVGKIADKMHENKCWPVLQGLQEVSAQSLPTITDCASLAPHIVQMTRDQDAQSNPAIIKLYGVKALDLDSCKQRGVLFSMRSTANDPITWVLNVRAINMMTEKFVSACGNIVGREHPLALTGAKPTNVLSCVGTAKYAFGYAQDEPRYFYLEKFSDGEEFFGISSLTQ